MLPSETMIWQPEFTDKTLSRKPGAVQPARVKRENEFIDQELKHKAAQTDVVQSEADANRNMTEGGRDLMKSVGKAEENKSDSWFN
ncbi:DUF5384 family protein [Escherichia coli]|nr:DUF5384 family protein [Escherichia coli]